MRKEIMDIMDKNSSPHDLKKEIIKEVLLFIVVATILVGVFLCCLFGPGYLALHFNAWMGLLGSIVALVIWFFLIAASRVSASIGAISIGGGLVLLFEVIGWTIKIVKSF